MRIKPPSAIRPEAFHLDWLFLYLFRCRTLKSRKRMIHFITGAPFNESMAKKQKRPRYPEPTVGALIFNQSGKLFLMRSHKWKNMYAIPGGHIEWGEKALSALRREIKEETNLSIYAIKFLAQTEFIFNKAFYKKRHFIFLDYYCKTRAREDSVVLNDEAEEYVWARLDETDKLQIEPYTKNVIKLYLKKSRKAENMKSGANRAREGGRLSIGGKLKRRRKNKYSPF